MEKLTLDNLLTWEDVIRLGDAVKERNTFFNKKILSDCCKNNYAAKQFYDSYDKYIVKPFYEAFPSCTLDINEHDLRFIFDKNKDGEWYLKYSFPHLIISIFTEFTPSGVSKDSKNKLLLMLVSDEQERRTLGLTLFEFLNEEIKKSIKEVRGLTFDLTDKIGTNVEKNYIVKSNIDELVKVKKQVKWFVDNYDQVFDYFEKEVPLELFENLEKDKFILNMLASSLIDNELLALHDDFKVIDSYDKLSKKIINNLNYSNNVQLYIDYIEEENKEKYEINMKLHSDDNSTYFLRSDEVLDNFKLLNERVKRNETLKSQVNYYENYEELFKAKATDTWNKIQNKKLVKNIRLNFDIIKTGSFNIDKDYSTRYHSRAARNGEKAQGKLKRAYDLLEEKFAYYESKEPEIKLVGISNFTGYFAHFYKNGTVILDRFYRYNTDKYGREKAVPASEEAIYIMNYRKFAELCQCTKGELIDMKKSDKDIDRKYHRTNWKKNIDKIIEGPGYGELDLDFLNELSCSEVKLLEKKKESN